MTDAVSAPTYHADRPTFLAPPVVFGHLPASHPLADSGIRVSRDWGASHAMSAAALWYRFYFFVSRLMSTRFRQSRRTASTFVVNGIFGHTYVLFVFCCSVVLVIFCLGVGGTASRVYNTRITSTLTYLLLLFVSQTKRQVVWVTRPTLTYLLLPFISRTKRQVVWVTRQQLDAAVVDG